MKKKSNSQKSLTAGCLLTAAAGILFLLSLAVVVTLCFRLLYYADILILHLDQLTGLSAEEIRRNYDALIDYNLFWKGISTLTFPDLPMSDHARIHFAEVKKIFVFLQYLCLLSGSAFLILAFIQHRKKEYCYLRVMAAGSLALPLTAGLGIACSWESFFIGFHKLFFKNNYWIFDPETDPIIDLLPDAFFLHCAIMIVCFILAGSIFCWVCSVRIAAIKAQRSAC